MITSASFWTASVKSPMNLKYQGIGIGKSGWKSAHPGVRVHSRDEEVEVAIPVYVTPGCAHRRSAVGHAGFGRPVSEGPVPVVVVEAVVAEFVGHVEVGPAVAVVVPPGCRHVPARTVDTGLLRHVVEGSIAAVAEQRFRARRCGRRSRASVSSVLVISHPRHIDVEEAIAIVIRDDGHSTPAPGRHAGLPTDVDEAAAAIVVEQPIPAGHRGDEEIRPAVVVVIQEDDAARGGGIRSRQVPLHRVASSNVSVAAAAVEDQFGAAREDQILATVAIRISDGDARGLAHRVLVGVAEQPERRRSLVGVDAVDSNRRLGPLEAGLVEGHQRSRGDLFFRDLPEGIEVADPERRVLLESWRRSPSGTGAANDQVDGRER